MARAGRSPPATALSVAEELLQRLPVRDSRVRGCGGLANGGGLLARRPQDGSGATWPACRSPLSRLKGRQRQRRRRMLGVVPGSRDAGGLLGDR